MFDNIETHTDVATPAKMLLNSQTYPKNARGRNASRGEQDADAGPHASDGHGDAFRLEYVMPFLVAEEAWIVHEKAVTGYMPTASITFGGEDVALAQVFTYGVQNVFEHCKEIKIDLSMNTPAHFAGLNVWEMNIDVSHPHFYHYYNLPRQFSAMMAEMAAPEHIYTASDCPPTTYIVNINMVDEPCILVSAAEHCLTTIKHATAESWRNDLEKSAEHRMRPPCERTWDQAYICIETPELKINFNNVYPEYHMDVFDTLYKVNLSGPGYVKLLLPSWHTVAYHMDSKDVSIGPSVWLFEDWQIDAATHYHDVNIPDLEDCLDTLLVRFTISKLRGTLTGYFAKFFNEAMLNTLGFTEPCKEVEGGQFHLCVLDPAPDGAKSHAGFECTLNDMTLALPTDLFHNANEDFGEMQLIGSYHIGVNSESDRMDFQMSSSNIELAVNSREMTIDSS